MLERRKAVIALGRQRFIDANPNVQKECASHTAIEAQHLGTTLEELRDVTVDRHLQSVASAKRSDIVEMLIRLGADNEQEAKTLIDDLHTEIRRALGIRVALANPNA